MTQPFKTIPTLEQLAAKLAQVHGEVRQLANAFGTEVAQTNATMTESTAITDQVLQEMALQIAFLMQIIKIAKPMNGGIAGPDGKVPMDVKTASQLYNESGRAMMVKQIEAARHAQGIPPAESPHDPSSQGDGHADAAPQDAEPASEVGPGLKLITH